MSGQKEKRKEKKFTLASRLAIVGSLLMLLISPAGIWFSPRPGVVQEPQPFFWLPLAIMVLCGLVTMICAVSVNYAPPKLKVALGTMIVVFSIISAISLFPLFPLWLGNVLAVIGGLWTMFGGENKIETKELSKEKPQELSEKENEKLTEEEKHMKEEYEQLMEED